MEGKVRRGIQSIEIGSELLGVLAQHVTPMALKDLAKAAGMSPGKAHPYLVSFLKVGFVTQDASGRYQLGPFALQLGLTRLQRLDVVKEASPLVEVLAAVPGPAVFPVHPRTRAKLEAAGLWEEASSLPNVRLVPPVGYLDFTALLVTARAVVTDSGGVQKEAFFHRVPCVTLRDTTEWVETVQGGFNRLVGMDAVQVRAALADVRMPPERPPYYGDGHASEHIADAVAAALG